MDTLKSRCGELTSRVQSLERELRQAELVRGDEGGAAMATGDQGDLADRLKNQEGELNHLRLSLLDMQNKLTKETAQKSQLQRKMEADRQQLTKKLESTKRINSDLEIAYSKSVVKQERLKNTAKELHKQLLAKHEIVQKLKKETPPTSAGVVKREPGEIQDVPPPDSVPELEEDEGPSNVVRVSLGKQIVLNVNATVGEKPNEEIDEEEEIDVGGGGGVSPPRSSYVPRRVSDAEMRDFFPDEDNLPPLSFDPPNSRMVS